MALDFIAGCVGGFAGIAVGHPLDTIKVRLQSQDPKNPRYSGTWNCFTEIVKKESFGGLFKGILSPLYGQVFINTIVFGIHGNTLKWLNDNSIRSQFIAGAVAGGVQSIVCSPVELVKIRFQMQGEGVQLLSTVKDQRFVYKSFLECLMKIYKYENGFRGVFRGLNLTIWREVPSFGVYFSSYEYLCRKTNAYDNNTVSIPKLFLSGGIAGILCWVCVYPLDVIKTRQQMDGMGKTSYKGIIDCAKQSYHKEGSSVFFRGLNASMIRAFPVNAATLTTVTIFLNCFKKSE